jgi:hypothetical protein
MGLSVEDDWRGDGLGVEDGRRWMRLSVDDGLRRRGLRWMILKGGVDCG